MTSNNLETSVDIRRYNVKVACSVDDTKMAGCQQEACCCVLAVSGGCTFSLIQHSLIPGRRGRANERCKRLNMLSILISPSRTPTAQFYSQHLHALTFHCCSAFRKLISSLVDSLGNTIQCCSALLGVTERIKTVPVKTVLF